MSFHTAISTPHSTGLFCWNDAQEGPQPGILLIHGGAGLDAHAREQACRYAALGYAVLACDMFGDGIAGDRERVMACLLGLRDNPDLLVRRGQAGLAALAGYPEAAEPTAAVGLCFGGMAALALARAGANLASTGLAAVVSIHGSLAAAARARRRRDGQDPRLPRCRRSARPPADVAAFAEEMNHAGADWQLLPSSGRSHGFTHKHAAPGATPGVAYDHLPPTSARSPPPARSWPKPSRDNHMVTGRGTRRR